ncbi:MAG: acylphosphatase [Chlamydiales bacterium]|nr:acylphosphatase [Chlamydiales bacterium]
MSTGSRAIFAGRVQGVGFRATAKRHADKLDITGYAKNLPDGSVEIVMQGEKTKLVFLIAELKKAFPEARLESLSNLSLSSLKNLFEIL